MNDKTISILGCGWLGLPLAQHLITLGFTVKGSTTTQDKISALRDSKIQPFLIRTEPQVMGSELQTFFDSHVLFLNIPFRRGLKDPQYYQKQIDSIIPYIEKSPVEFVIFASSTSIYPESVANAREDEALHPDTSRAKVLNGVEQSLLVNDHFQTTVIRFAGLYGGKRRIGQILAGRTNLINGESPVNLIHLEDCIAIITAMIQKDIRNEIFNACSDGHPSRKTVYTKAAQHYGLNPPQFNDQPQTRFKVVRNEKLKEKLNYTFRHPDPLIF